MKNMKLMPKLLLGFSAVAVVALAIGYFGLTATTQITTGVQGIWEDTMPSLERLETIDMAAMTIDDSEKVLMVKGITEDLRQNTHATLDAAKKEADSAIGVYGSQPKTGDEADFWKHFQQAWDAWWKDHETFATLVQEYESSPTDENYARLTRWGLDSRKASFNDLRKALAPLIEFEKNEGADIVSESGNLSARVHVIAIIGSVAGPLIALLLGILVALSISRSLARGVKFAQLVAGGDFTQRLDIERRDEVGILARALNDMSTRLRDMVTTLRESAEQVAASSVEISSGSQSLAEGAQNQASTLEETSASIEELTASVDVVNEHAQAQAAAVEQGSSSMRQVQKSIDEVSHSLREISELAAKSVANAQEGAEAVQQVVQGITLIAASSEKIGGIVTVISDIANQTNLLALNAAIEAARAGEHGRGFAVVADEVSKLADKSSTSTKEIEGLIREGVKNVTRGVEIANSSRGAIEQIRGASQKVKDMIAGLTASIQQQVRAVDELATALATVSEMSQGISAATEQQTASAKQVSKAVEGVNELTQAAASSAEEMSRSTVELSRMAQVLQGMTEKFKISSDGNRLSDVSTEDEEKSADILPVPQGVASPHS